MFSVEENSTLFLVGAAAFLAGAAAATGSPRRTSARIAAIVERITLPPCVLPRRLERLQKMNRAWPFCGAAASFAAGCLPHSRRLWQKHSQQTCRRTNMGRSILVAILAAAGLLAL